MSLFEAYFSNLFYNSYDVQTNDIIDAKALIKFSGALQNMSKDVSFQGTSPFKRAALISIAMMRFVPMKPISDICDPKNKTFKEYNKTNDVARANSLFTYKFVVRYLSSEGFVQSEKRGEEVANHKITLSSHSLADLLILLEKIHTLDSNLLDTTDYFILSLSFIFEQLCYRFNENVSYEKMH